MEQPTTLAIIHRVWVGDFDVFPLARYGGLKRTPAQRPAQRFNPYRC